MSSQRWVMPVFKEWPTMMPAPLNYVPVTKIVKVVTVQDFWGSAETAPKEEPKK